MGYRPEDLFTQLDTDRSGRLARSELEPVLCRLQPDLTVTEREAIFARFDQDRSGEVEVHEFCQALREAAAPANPAGPQAPAPSPPPAVPGRGGELLARIASSMARMGYQPHEVFAQLDEDRDRRLSRAELEPVLLRLQPDLAVAEREELFSLFDRDGSGHVELSEFCQALQRAAPGGAGAFQPHVGGQAGLAPPRPGAAAAGVVARLAASVARTGATPQGLFARLDRDGSGQLSRGELEPLLRRLQPALSPQDLEGLFGHFDRDGSGLVDSGEFCRALQPGPPEPQAGAAAAGVVARLAASVARTGATPQGLFAKLDSDGNGRLSRSELEPLLRRLQPDLSLQDLAAVFQRFDRDGSGQVDSQEFCNALQGALPGGSGTGGGPALPRPGGPPEPPAGAAAGVVARLAASVARTGATPHGLFAKLDRDGNGRLSRGELEPLLRRLQPDLSLQDLAAVFQRFDRDGSGQVDSQEFCNALQSALLGSSATGDGLAPPQRHGPPEPPAGAAAAGGVLARLAASVARTGATPHGLFAKLDRDGNGRLSRGELEPLLRRLQPDLSPQDLAALLSQFDRDGDGQVDSQEFCGALEGALHGGGGSQRAAPAAQRVQEILARIAGSTARTGHAPEALFKQLDRDGSGRLSQVELEPFLQQLQPDLSPQELQAVFQRFDMNRSGQVDSREFCQALKDAYRPEAGPGPPGAARPAAPRPLPLRPAPPAGGPRALSVDPEDLHMPPQMSRQLSRASSHGARQRASARGGKKRREVYVQNVRDATRFARVSGDRVRPAEGGGGGGRSFSKGGARRAAERAAADVAVVRAATLVDPDAAWLRPHDAGDAGVLDLLTSCRHVEETADLIFFVCQCLVVGLCMPAAALAVGSDGDGELLRDALVAMAPALTSAVLALVEVAFIGSLIRAYRAHAAYQELGAASSVADQEPGERRLLAFRRSLLAALQAAANAAVLACCLIGGRGAAVLSLLNAPTCRPHCQPADGSAAVYVWQLEAAEEEWRRRTEDSWSASEASNLMLAKCILALMALALGMPEARDPLHAWLARSSPRSTEA